MLSANQAAAELAMELYSDCVRWLLLVGGGYECQVGHCFPFNKCAPLGLFAVFGCLPQVVASEEAW